MTNNIAETQLTGLFQENEIYFKLKYNCSFDIIFILFVNRIWKESCTRKTVMLNLMCTETEEKILDKTFLRA